MDYELESKPDEARPLDLDERGHVGMFAQQRGRLAQQWDVDAAEPHAEPRRLVHLDFHHLGERQIEQAALETGGAPEVGIMRKDGYAIGRELHIEFQIARSRLDGGPQRGQRVLRVAERIAAVGDQLGRIDADV